VPENCSPRRCLDIQLPCSGGYEVAALPRVAAGGAVDPLVVQGLRNREIAHASNVRNTGKFIFPGCLRNLVFQTVSTALLGLGHSTPDIGHSRPGREDPADADPMKWVYIHGATKDRPDFPSFQGDARSRRGR